MRCRRIARWIPSERLMKADCVRRNVAGWQVFDAVDSAYGRKGGTSHRRAAAARSCAGRTAEAMRADADETVGEGCGRRIEDGLRSVIGGAELQHLIEVAVVQRTVPP